METRVKIWNRLATDFKPNNLEELIQQEVTLEQLPEVLPTLLKGSSTRKNSCQIIIQMMEVFFMNG